jgi:hypothetical protein
LRIRGSPAPVLVQRTTCTEQFIQTFLFQVPKHTEGTSI